MSAKDDVDTLLIECGAIMKRNHKHEVWLLPNGQQFTRAKTSSDRRADHCDLSDLKHALGIVKTKTIVGERRERKRTNGTAPPKLKRSLTLAEQLITTGVVEQGLKTQNDDLKVQVNNLQQSVRSLETKNERLRLVSEAYLREHKQCWGCRLRRWGRKWHSNLVQGLCAGEVK